MATGNKLTGLTDPKAVTAAMKEFRHLGRDQFIAEYSKPGPGFRRSTDFFILEGAVPYDSKPLLAAAYGHQHGRRNALHSDDFSGGAPVQAAAERLGFKLVRWTSGRLEPNRIYTREDLRKIFGVTDATLNNGIFQPSGEDSVWLFVTAEKPFDRTPYVNVLKGDLLQFQGQMAGRTDRKIIDHRDTGAELLVFYRDSTRQYPGGGFRYEGPFDYVSHAGGGPTSFVLRRAAERSDTEFPEFDFDPTSIEDGRRKIWGQVKRRQGQPAFRRHLLAAYGGQCAITDCSVEALLEAAHILPYRGKETNVVQNGLLLRADIHTLFDLGLIAVGRDRRVLVSERLAVTEYAALKGKPLRATVQRIEAPSSSALEWHRHAHEWRD
nr:HNH endonuclease [Brevundimonas diminuta]